jgi:DNA-binding response OmpR family regulator
MEADRTQRRALVLDADRASTSLMAALLRTARKCATFEAADAPGARALLVQAVPDIIFVAHAPPGVDAPVFTRDLRHSDLPARKTPVVMLAPEPTESLTLAARDAGVHEVLRKPFTMKDLLLRYDLLLGKERNWIEGIAYVGPDRRRFNSAHFAGARKRRVDTETLSPENARIGQALRIMKAAIDSFDSEPRQALRALRAQADELQSVAAAMADYALAGAAKTLKQYLDSSPRLSQRQLAANLDGMIEAVGAQDEPEPRKRILWVK